MENKQYLNEEKYQKNKKNIIKIAFVIIMLGLLIGGGLIVTGIQKYNEMKIEQSEVNFDKVIPFVIFGAFIAIISLIWGVYIYAFAMRREIQAFKTQQSIPVEKEKIETMTQTYADATKDISKAVAEGIKEGKE